MSLISQYALLGKSGLRVSPLCLGAMTFGTDWGWGSPEETVSIMLNKYFEAGGNFLDTADAYTNGKSEEMVGKYLKESGKRDRVVLATKFTFNTVPGDPNAGGNGRKNLLQALEGSLRRLQTDYINNPGILAEPLRNRKPYSSFRKMSSKRIAKPPGSPLPVIWT